MEAHRWGQIEELFDQAVTVTPAERPALLDRVCNGNEELRREVESLLAAAAIPDDGFLQAAVGRVVEQLPVNSDESADLIGKCVGRYSITGFIGKGGMGAVYRAVREDDFHMEVAIKLLKRGTDTDSTLSRFRVERRILAGLQHPNIARLLDGGATETGLPWFAMEYVDGRPLLEYARPISLRQRIELFRLVCSAVEYAHQNLIVHRDIKPANILVTREGVPKLLDFGIAKLLDPTGEGVGAALTATGRLAMTPDYASPEQMRGEPVTPATDVYSLGAVLYELLTGRRPHNIETYSPGAIEKEICAREPRRPRSLVSDLDPDLDNIVMMALRKEPERRYASVAEFSADLGRFLQDLPIRARPETVPYRTRKFLKRHRVAISAALFGAILVLGVDLEWHPSYRSPFVPYKASVAVLPLRDFTSPQGPEYFSDGVTQELADGLAKVPEIRVAGLSSASQFKDKPVDPRTIGQKLNVAAYLEGSVRANGDQVRIAVRLVRTADGSQMWSETFDRGINDIVDVQEEIGHRVAAALQVDLHGRKTAPQRTNTEAYRSYLQGNYFLAHGKVDKAVEYSRQSIELDPNYAPAWSTLAEARIFQAGAGLIPAAEGYRQARETIARALVLDPNLADAHAVLAEIETFHDWDWAGAVKSSRRALELEPGNSGIVSVAASLARVTGELDKAIALYHRTLEIDPLHTNAYKNLGVTLYYAGRDEEAAANINKAYEQLPGMWDGHFYLAQIYLMESRPREALAEADKEKRPAFRLAGLALAYYALGRKSESDANLTQLAAEYPKETPCQIAEVYTFRGEKDKAFEWLERAYNLRDDSLTEIKVDPLLKSLRNDRRYTDLVRKMGLPL